MCVKSSQSTAFPIYATVSCTIGTSCVRICLNHGNTRRTLRVDAGGMQGVTETRLEHPEASGNGVFDVFDAIAAAAGMPWASM
ncbi:hypothetical protein N7491_006959 [Penicillium cf. griseofulvum]|uniref:Uncharacterized protein n=1 Tax=Penicillium cf. griseofulvum TaxID=2972120 RepID=A0A9W9M1H7_9EURO|nr:hypothetical protein N7472_010009 [Penicillium cf. griseofulvum]KAJ5429943.1 hypothetical protein N7491_006959 [Penicillium cf. griseofulvum]